MEGRVYIANLRAYNEGKAVGSWFSMPVNPDEVDSRLNLRNGEVDMAIHDSELPFPVDEYMSLEELNKEWACFEELPEEFQKDVKVLVEHYRDVEAILENVENIIFYDGIHESRDLAEFCIKEKGVLEEVPKEVRDYIDYESMGRDMEINGQFIWGKNGVFEILRV